MSETRTTPAAGNPIDSIPEGFTPEESPFEDEQTESDTQNVADQSRHAFDDDSY